VGRFPDRGRNVKVNNFLVGFDEFCISMFNSTKWNFSQLLDCSSLYMLPVKIALASTRSCRRAFYVRYKFVWRLPPIYFPSLRWGSGDRAPGGSGDRAPSRPGSGGILPENFWNSMCDLLRFVAVWWQFVGVGWQLYVGCQTQYISNSDLPITLSIWL